MEIEMKNYAEGTDRLISQQAVETLPEDIVKRIIKSGLKDEAKEVFPESCKILRTLLMNIINSPEEYKYRSIKQKNPKFNKNLGRFENGVLLLECAGFEEVEGEEPLFIYAHNDIEMLKR